MKRLLPIIVMGITLLSIGQAAAHGDTLKVLATTTILADVARNVAGDHAEVSSLIPPDTDIHAFEPTPQDVVKVAEADVVLAVGAGLESFLGDLVANAVSAEPVIVSNAIEMLSFGGGEHGEAEPEHSGAEVIGVLGEEGICEEDHHEQEAAAEDEHEHGACDPHVWTDPNNVMVWARNIAEALAVGDPEDADLYRENAAIYIEQLTALDEEVTQILSVIPEAERILVTNHEFFGYFAHHYGFEVVGVVIEGGTTLNEPDPQTLAELIEVVKAEQVRAIFAEISATPSLAETVAEAAGISVVTDLYSDSLSAADGPAGTYLDYLRHNAQVIADALS